MTPPEQNVIEMGYFIFALIIGVIASESSLNNRFTHKYIII